MFLTMEECAKAWECAGQHGSKKERIARNAKWIPFYSYAAQKQIGNTSGPDDHAREVAQTLQKTGVLYPGAAVLDLGCGTGGYSLAFAEQGMQVTALDMDSASLSVLRNRAEANNIHSIETKQAMWEEYASDSVFDVAFSSMCPAICDYGELLRFEGMAKNYCCLMAVSRDSYDLHRKALMQELKVHPVGGMTTEALWYMNMLYLMGRQPNVIHYTQHSAYQMPVEAAVEWNRVYFEIFGMNQEDSEPKLRDYYNRHSTNGIVYDESHINTALIWWKVPKKSMGK